MRKGCEMKNAPKRTSKISVNQKDKARFRKSVEWTDLREQFLLNHDSSCQCCGRKMPSSKLQLHHRDLDPNHYTDISDTNKFKILCNNCHQTVHSLYTILNNKKNKYKNLEMLTFIAPYFILSDYLKEIIAQKVNR